MDAVKMFSGILSRCSRFCQTGILVWNAHLSLAAGTGCRDHDAFYWMLGIAGRGSWMQHCLVRLSCGPHFRRAQRHLVLHVAKPTIVVLLIPN